MQTGLLFFQSISDDSSLTVKKGFQDPGSVTGPAEKGTLAEDSIFLATLRQIANQPQRSRLNSALIESLRMAQDPLLTANPDSEPILQGRPGEELEWLNFFINSASGLQNTENRNGPASAAADAGAPAVSVVKDVGPVVPVAHSDPLVLDPVSQTTTPGAETEILFDQLKNQILNILDGAKDKPVKDLSTRSLKQTGGSEAGAATLFSVLKNRIIDFLKTNPSPQPSDPLTKTDPVLSDGFNQKDVLETLISDLMHWRRTDGSLPLAPASHDNFQLPEPGINPQGPVSDPGRYGQALLVKLLSHLKGRQNGVENNPSVQGNRATAGIPAENVTTDPPKISNDFQFYESVPGKTIPLPGDSHNERDQAAKSGLDVSQPIKPASDGEIVARGKDAPATHLNTTAAAPSTDRQNQLLNDQAPKNDDARSDVSRGVAIQTPASETESPSSEAEREPRELRDSGPRIQLADRFAMEDPGARATKIIPENGDKATLISNHLGSENFSETASSAKDSDPAANFSRTATMSQIVEKAALTLKNGQSELRLNLKPDFLGQIHMRIVTENHQVTLKISTEFAAVKDIIEHNIYQLKADLQNHGLEINSLDVSVTKDSHQQGSGHHPTDPQKAGSNAGNRSGKDNREPTELNQPNADGGERNSDNAIDYFA